MLQVFHSSLSTRLEGLPEELERGREMPSHSLFWSRVSAIFRRRLQGGQRDENSTSGGLTRHALCWQLRRLMASSYVAFSPNMLHSPLLFRIQAILAGISWVRMQGFSHFERRRIKSESGYARSGSEPFV